MTYLPGDGTSVGWPKPGVQVSRVRGGVLASTQYNPELVYSPLVTCRTVSLTSGCGALGTGFLNRDLRFGFANSDPHWVFYRVRRYDRYDVKKIPGFLVDEIV